MTDIPVRRPYIPAARTIPATLSSLTEIGSHVRAFVQACGVGDRDATAAALELAVHEVAVNIVRHAYAGTRGGWIGATFLIEGDDLVVTLDDAGRPYVAPTHAEPDLTQANEGGYGLYLVRQLVDDLAYTRLRGGNRWRLRIGRSGRRLDTPERPGAARAPVVGAL